MLKFDQVLDAAAAGDEMARYYLMGLAAAVGGSEEAKKDRAMMRQKMEEVHIGATLGKMAVDMAGEWPSLIAKIKAESGPTGEK